MRLEHVRRAVFAMPWAIQEEKLAAILEVLELRAAGVALSPDFTAAAPRPIEEVVALEAAAAGRPAAVNEGKVAILQLFGVLSQRMSMLEQQSGGTSTEKFGKVFDAVLANDEIRAIILQIDSPGGAVAGTAELADRIFQARGQKRVVAIADSLAASAAYWIGSSASEFWATPTADVGSIGVIALHEDVSKAADEAGVKYTIVKAGKFKGEGNPYETLSAEAQAAMQSRVDELYGMFVKSVARGRGVSVDDVRGGFGQGRALGADAAKAAGMIDRIGTLDDVLVSLRAKPGPNARAQIGSLALRQALLEEELTS